MCKKDKIFYKKLKKIQLAHKPEKWEAIKPYNWKKEWGPIVKYNADWDGCYLLDLIIYKLEKMYLGLDIYSNEVRESLDKKLKVLKETIELGKKLQTHDYDEEYHEFGKEHCAHVILVYKKEDGLKSKPIHEFVHWSSQEDFNLDGTKEDFKKDMDHYLGTTEVKTWAKENGYDPKELTTAYSGKWDSDENSKIYKKLVKKCCKAKQDDTDKFFKLIAKNYRGWWW